MTNEYGAPLDRNGYAPSIIPNHGNERCWLCARNGMLDPLNRHEVFGGAYRQKSKRLGLWVHLCHSDCHQGDNGVHQNAQIAAYLKAEAQKAAMEHYGWTIEEFIQQFGRNYLDTE